MGGERRSWVLWVVMAFLMIYIGGYLALRPFGTTGEWDVPFAEKRFHTEDLHYISSGGRYLPEREPIRKAADLVFAPLIAFEDLAFGVPISFTHHGTQWGSRPVAMPGSMPQELPKLPAELEELP